MILNSKTFFNIQLDIFRMFRDSEAIKPEDVKPLAMASKIIYENYGRLKNKETRLQVFGELYKAAIEDWGNDAPLKKYQDYLTGMGEPVQWRWEGVEK